MKSRDVNNYLSGSSRVRRRKKFFHWLIFGVAIVYVLFIGFGILVLRTGLFRAKAIFITGNKEVVESDIRTALQSQVFGGHSIYYLFGFNNLLIWPNHIQNPDKFLPQIKSLDIEKNYWTKTITVRVEERSPYGIWCASSFSMNCFWFDETGKIFKKGPLSQGNLIKTVDDSSGRNLGLGEYVLAPGYFQNLGSIFETVDASGLSVDGITLKDLALEEVDVKTTEGPTLYFSLRISCDWALPALKSLTSQSSFGKLKYVDLRIKNRAYYK